MPGDPTLLTARVLAMLAASPARIAALTADLPPARLYAAPAQGEWSANDVLAHLRACADVWGDAIGRMLAEERPTIRAVSPRTWMKRTDYREQEFSASLRSFATQRVELLAILEALPPEAWSRAASVRREKSVLMRTVLDLAELLARHEQPHVEQLGRAVGALEGA